MWELVAVKAGTKFRRLRRHDTKACHFARIHVCRWDYFGVAFWKILQQYTCTVCNVCIYMLDISLSPWSRYTPGWVNIWMWKHSGWSGRKKLLVADLFHSDPQQPVEVTSSLPRRLQARSLHSICIHLLSPYWIRWENPKVTLACRVYHQVVATLFPSWACNPRSLARGHRQSQHSHSREM